MISTRTQGILLLLTGNLLLLTSLGLNIYWSNYTLRDTNEFPTTYDAILRAIYVVAFLTAFIGLRKVLKNHQATSEKLTRLIIPLGLFILPALILIGQVLQLGLVFVK